MNHLATLAAAAGAGAALATLIIIHVLAQRARRRDQIVNLTDPKWLAPDRDNWFLDLGEGPTRAVAPDREPRYARTGDPE